MVKRSEYGKPHGVRFVKELEKEFLAYCALHEKNEATVIHEAVECFLRNPNCLAKRRK